MGRDCELVREETRFYVDRLTAYFEHDREGDVSGCAHPFQTPSELGGNEKRASVGVSPGKGERRLLG